MALPIDILLEEITAEQANEKLLTIMETIGVPARSWVKGGRARTILRAISTGLAWESRLRVAFAKSFHLETSQSGWLTLVAKKFYGVDRRAATFALGKVLLTNTGGAVHTKNPGEVRARNPVSGKVYTNTEAISLLTPGATQLVAFQAVEQGAASSTAANTVTELETVLLGVECTNPEAIIGSDADSDADLVLTCLAKLASLSERGPRGAYDYAVRVAKRIDGSPVDINRSSRRSINGTVEVFVASPSGAPAPGDLEAIEESIEATARPDSVTATVTAAVAVPYTRTLTVWAQKTTGVDSAALKTAAENALIAFFRDFAIGGLRKPPSLQGYLYADRIDAIVINSHPSIFDCDGSGDDLPLAPNEVATNAVTVNVRIV